MSAGADFKPTDSLSGECLGDRGDLAVEQAGEELTLAGCGNRQIRERLLQAGIPCHDATETEELVLNGVQLALIGCGAEQSFASEQFERVDQVAGRRPVLACSCLHGGERLGADLSGEQLLCQSLATSGRCRSVSQRAAKSALAVEYLDHREELGPA